MRHLPLRSDFTPTEDLRYNAAAYPGVGLYQYGRDLVIVYEFPLAGAVPVIQRTAITIPGGTSLLEGLPDHAPKAQGFSESFVLKALAISQRPDLAKDLAGD